MTAFILRFLAAGLLVATLPLVAHKFGDTVAGIVLLFPLLTFTGLLVLGLERGIDSIARASISSVLGIPTVLVFLLTVYFTARQRMAIPFVFGSAFTAWFVCAVLIISATQHRE